MRNIVFRLVWIAFTGMTVISCNEDTIDPTRSSSINGTVLQSSSNQPVAGASITTSPPTTAIITDSLGHFLIENIAVGNYAVTARKEGYLNETVSINVAEDRTNVVTMLLKTGSGANDAVLPEPASPGNNATEQPVALTLAWDSGSDKDSLKYDVLLYESNSLEETVVARNLADTSLTVEGLKFSTTYFWQVIAKDGGNVVRGKVWSFKTIGFPDDVILFARQENNNFEIYAADSLGTYLYSLTDSPAREWYPVLGPGRDKIAYTSLAGAGAHIYLMDPDGSGKSKITTLPIAGYHNPGIGFSWSPDGGNLLYSHYNSLYRISRHGTGLTLVSKAPADRHYRECDWTAQGDKIVALTIGEKIYDSELYTMNANGSGRTMVLGNLPGIMGSPSFSLDGNKIMFTRDVSGFESRDGRQLDSHIFVMDSDGANIIDLSAGKPDGTNDLYPRFNSDGSGILFVNVRNSGLGSPEIWIMDPDGNNRRKLFANATMPF